MGHVHISLIALRALKLDAIWWLITPQNPLKKNAGPYAERLNNCLSITAPHPRILVTDIERQAGLTRSYDTLRFLKYRFPRTDFVWITGIDNAHIFHKWYRWREILDLVPTAHIARPPAGQLARMTSLRMMGKQRHTIVNRPLEASLAPHQSYWILQQKMLALSSTALRTK